MLIFRSLPVVWFSSIFIPCIILSIFSPVTTTDASSTASGLSWDSRIFKALKFKMDDSSKIVPLSDITTKDSICSLL